MPISTIAVALIAAAYADAAVPAPICARAASGGRTTSAPVAAHADARTIERCVVAADRVDTARTTLVDARRAGGLRIALPSAIAFDPDTGAPPFGMAEPVALIGHAADVRHLVAHCARLRAAGYANVRVVAGGVDAWRRALRLPAAANPPVRWLTSSALERRALDAPHALVFDVSSDPALHRLGDAAHAARRGEAPADAAARIARSLERRRVVPGVDPIVVVVADRGAAPAWRDAWNATRYPDPEFHVGTDADYRRDVATAARVAADRGKPLPGPCDR